MEDDRTWKEKLMDKIYQLLFDWECSPGWYQFARYVELFIMDPFVDLFITLCIVSNTAFMACDHDDISPQFANVLNIGNNVRRFGLSIEFIAVVIDHPPFLGFVKFLYSKFLLCVINHVAVTFRYLKLPQSFSSKLFYLSLKASLTFSLQQTEYVFILLYFLWQNPSFCYVSDYLNESRSMSVYF